MADESTTEILINNNLDIKKDITIPSGKTVKITKTVALSKGTLTNYGKIVMANDAGSSSVTFDAATKKATLLNKGTIEVIADKALKEDENIINSKTIVVKPGASIEENNGKNVAGEDIKILGTGKVSFEIGTYKPSEDSEEITSTSAQIVSAITNTSATEVKLINDFTVTNDNKINITKNSLSKLTKVADFDLNGYTIKSSVDYVKETKEEAAINVEEKIDLTIKNGKIENTNSNTTGRNIINKGTLTINNVTMKGNYNVVSELNSTTNIIGGEYTAKECGVFGKTKSKTTISGATITSDGFAVSGNGTQTDTTIVIKDKSVLTSKNDVAIYMPSTKLLQVLNSKVTGNSGIETAAGNVEIINSEVIATAKGQVAEWVHEDGNNTSGASVNDRSALLVMSREGYGDADKGSITVTIENSTLSSVLGKAIRTHVNKIGDAYKTGVKTIVVTYDDATVLDGEVVNDKIVPNGISITVNGEKVPQMEAAE